MINTAIKETGVQKLQVGRALYGMNQSDTAQDFLAIVLQQLAGMSETDAVDSLLTQMQGEQMMQEDEEKNGNELAMQMLAELFLPNLPAEDLLQQTSSVSEGLVQQQTAQSPISGILEQLSPAMQQELRKFEDMQGKPVQTMYGQALASSGEKADVAQVISVEPTEEKGTTLLGGESQFQSSVQEALKLMKAQRKDEHKDEYMVDVDKMQQEVNAGKFSTTSAVHKTETPMLDSKDLITQLQNGIQEHISKGKNEFVVKLKPEGLGEITIRMSEQDSKISLSIITSSTQVARALSGELTTLRESLRPLQADVHEVITQSQNAFSAAQNEQYGQNYHGHQNRQFNRQVSQPTYSQADEVYAADLTDLSSALKMASGLDTYI